jgi:putative addiction module component (TIGR02574 family)
MQRADIMKAVMDLPEDDREQLVEELNATLHGGFASKEIEAAWATEVERRIEEVESGKVKMLPWDDVQREILEDLATIRGH